MGIQRWGTYCRFGPVFFFTSGKAPEQGYKSCASLTKLAERYGAKRLESACERLLGFTAAPSIRSLNTILKNGQYKLPPGAAVQEGQRNDRQHGITRGAAYFPAKGVRPNDGPVLH